MLNIQKCKENFSKTLINQSFDLITKSWMIVVVVVVCCLHSNNNKLNSCFFNFFKSLNHPSTLYPILFFALSFNHFSFIFFSSLSIIHNFHFIMLHFPFFTLLSLTFPLSKFNFITSSLLFPLYLFASFNSYLLLS